MRRWLATIPQIAAMSVSSGCEYYRCRWGTLPMDGATGVPLDAVVEFTSDESLPEMLPEDMTAAFTLRIDHGNGVPFDVEVRGDTLVLRPREPLKPGFAYVASGADFLALRNDDQHWWGQTDLGTKRIQFQTGGLPTLLEAIATPTGRVVAVFSEPMDLDSMSVAFELVSPISTLVTGAGGTTSSFGSYGYYYYNTDFTLSEPTLLEVVGNHLDHPNLVELDAGPYTEYVGYYALALRVDPRVSSLRGPLLDTTTTQTPILAAPIGDARDRWNGRPTCSFR
jgi:hypothetical protein